MTVLRKTVRIIKIIAYIVVAYYLFDWTVAQLIPIRFADFKITKQINLCSIYLLPISISLTLFGLFESDRDKSYKIKKIILTISTAIILFFILTRFGSMILLGSVKLTDSTLFESKYNRNIKIIERHDDAGLFGEGPKENYKIRNLASIFIIETKIDTASIDKKEWIRINSH